MTVMIGVDPHKGSHTAVAVDATEQALGECKVRSGPAQLDRLLSWAQRFPERSWAVENATGLGYLLAQQLVGAGERVLDVQPKLAARVRLLDSQSVNKNDPHDARSVAIAALRSPAPTEVRAEDHSAVAKLWSKRQRDLARARNKVACRLHSLLCELIAGGVPDEIYAAKAAKLLASVQPEGAVAAARVELAEELLEDLRRLDGQIKESKRRLDAVVKASRTSTTKVFGVGPVVAATAIGLTGDVARFPDRDHFASFNGTAPIDVSSGGKKVYRLSRRGSRHLNHGGHPDPPPPQRGTRLLRPQGRRGQGPQGSPPLPQAAHQRRALRLHGGRRQARWKVERPGPGRAIGERLCLQRGRLTPRDTGSSDKPLPGPSSGYGSPPEVVSNEDSSTEEEHRSYTEGDSKSLLTNKEDSF
jgi:transposase